MPRWLQVRTPDDRHRAWWMSSVPRHTTTHQQPTRRGFLTCLLHRANVLTHCSSTSQRRRTPAAGRQDRKCFNFIEQGRIVWMLQKRNRICVLRRAASGTALLIDEHRGGAHQQREHRQGSTLSTLSVGFDIGEKDAYSRAAQRSRRNRAARRSAARRRTQTAERPLILQSVKF